MHFPEFKEMVKSIHRVQELPTEDRSVEAAAMEVFSRSRLDLETGFITESVFLHASLNIGGTGGFRGTDDLFRLAQPLFPFAMGANVAALGLDPDSGDEGGMGRARAKRTGSEESDAPGGPASPGPDEWPEKRGKSETDANSRPTSPVAMPPRTSPTGSRDRSPEPGVRAEEAPAVAVAATPQVAHVRLAAVAVHDGDRSQPHTAQTVRKISSIAMPRATPRWTASAEVLELADHVLRNVLHPDYEPPPAQLFDVPRFDLVTEPQLRALFSAAQTAVAADDMLVEVPAPTRIFGDIHGQLPDLLHFFHTSVPPCPTFASGVVADAQPPQVWHP